MEQSSGPAGSESDELPEPTVPSATSSSTNPAAASLPPSPVAPSTTAAPETRPEPDPGVIQGSYGGLSEQEQRSVEAPAPFQPVVEGRVGSTYWRLSAHLDGDQVCTDLSLGRGDEGTSLKRGCEPQDHWGTAWLAESGFAGFFGFAGLEAEALEVVVEDGRTARFSPGFLPERRVSFYVVWLSCDDEIDRLHALNESGRELSRLRFPEGTVADICEP